MNRTLMTANSCLSQTGVHDNRIPKLFTKSFQKVKVRIKIRSIFLADHQRYSLMVSPHQRRHPNRRIVKSLKQLLTTTSMNLIRYSTLTPISNRKIQIDLKLYATPITETQNYSHPQVVCKHFKTNICLGIQGK